MIRTDASRDIGTGHVMRCIVLAKELRQKNAEVTFICRELPGNMLEYIKDNGFGLIPLPATSRSDDNLRWHKQHWKVDAVQTRKVLKGKKDVDWLVVDHYGLDFKWEQSIRSLAKKIMVIDDLADRNHDCDLLLDQNLYKDMETRYQTLIPKTATALLGPKYLLLREEFRNLPVKERTGMVEKVLISFGGSDPTNETMKALKAVLLLKRPELAIDVVIGYSNKNQRSISRLCDDLPNVHLHFQIDYLASLMAAADLAVGAGGTTTWERCLLGLPAVTIETAPNQTGILSYLSELGAIQHLGKSGEVDAEKVADQLEFIIARPAMVKKMSDNSIKLMNGFAFGSVAEELVKGEA